MKREPIAHDWMDSQSQHFSTQETEISTRGFPERYHFPASCDDLPMHGMNCSERTSSFDSAVSLSQYHQTTPSFMWATDRYASAYPMFQPHCPSYHHTVYGYHPHFSFYPPPPPPVEYITVIKPQDVLSGRGGATNSHSGNREFRRLVKQYQKDYLHAKKRDKPAVAALVVEIIRRRGGRFLRKLDQTNHIGQVFYVEIGDERAKEKACQALREGGPILRRKNTEGTSAMDNDEHESKEQCAVGIQKSDQNLSAKETVAKDRLTSYREKPENQPAEQDETSLLCGEEPIMIRPCARLLPFRSPVGPISIDQLSPEKRDMYLHGFLPPSHTARPKRPHESLQQEEIINIQGENQNKECVRYMPFIPV